MSTLPCLPGISRRFGTSRRDIIHSVNLPLKYLLKAYITTWYLNPVSPGAADFSLVHRLEGTRGVVVYLSPLFPPSLPRRWAGVQLTVKGIIALKSICLPPNGNGQSLSLSLGSKKLIAFVLFITSSTLAREV